MKCDKRLYLRSLADGIRHLTCLCTNERYDTFLSFDVSYFKTANHFQIRTLGYMLGLETYQSEGEQWESCFWKGPERSEALDRERVLQQEKRITRSAMFMLLNYGVILLGKSTKSEFRLILAQPISVHFSLMLLAMLYRLQAWCFSLKYLLRALALQCCERYTINIKGMEGSVRLMGIKIGKLGSPLE